MIVEFGKTVSTEEESGGDIFKKDWSGICKRNE